MTELWANPALTQATSASSRRGWIVAIVVALAIGIAGPAFAQTTPANPPKASAVSPAEASRTLSLLRDDKRRAELINTLETIAKAAPTASAPEPSPAETIAAGPAAATAADTPAPAAAPATRAIAPDSVGAQLAGRMSVMLNAYARQLAESLRSVNDLPLLWRWLDSQAADPAARAEALEAGETLLIVLAAGLVVEWLVRRVLRTVRGTIVSWSPHDTVADPEAPGTHEVEVRRRRFERILGAVRLIPYLLARLLVDLVPVAAFIGVAELLLGAMVGASGQSRLIVLQAVEAYATARIVFAVTTFLVSPVPPRLLAVTDWAASFVTVWVRRLTIIGVTGYAISNIGLLFGMYHTAQLAILKLFAFVIHLCLVIAVLQVRKPVAHRLHARRGATGVLAALCNRFADIWQWCAIFLIVAAWLVWAVEVRNGYERLLSFCGATVAIVVVARLVAVLILGGLDRVRTVLSADGYGDRASVYYPFLRFILSAAIWLAAGVALLEAWGLPLLFWLTAGGLGARVADAALTIVVAILLAVAAWESVNAVAARHLTTLSSTSQLARAGRLRTLLPLMRTVLLVTIVLIVGMIALSAIGVNIAPLLAGAGVIGIAVGFGSQKLVQDLITGLFLLLENSMQVGDVVTVAGMTGTVEALSIRVIRLRAIDGSVHLIPFSAVTTVTNQTRDYSYAVLDVSIGLNEEPAPMEIVLREVAAEMQADPAWQSMVLDKLDVMGVDKLTDTAWIMRVRIKTQPSSRWAVSRELNRRIKERFDASAIESPFTSHRVLSREAPVSQIIQPEQAA